MNTEELMEMILHYGDLRASSELWLTHSLSATDKQGKRKMRASARRCKRESVKRLDKIEAELRKLEAKK